MATQRAPLPESCSVLLDVIRFSAALLVVIAHLSRPEFSVVTTRDLQFLGDLAVPIFFVLSGFVIRFVTVSREHTLRAYLIDRASRIYSVALPAMALTLAVTTFVLLANPRYAAETITPVLNHPLIRIAANLTFVSQIWGFNTVQFVNSPFWSLSYECLFYIAYGLFFYLRGARRMAALILWASISGPQILFLFPLWLLGCALYDVYQQVRVKLVATVLRRLTLLYAIAALALAAIGHTSLLLAPVHLDRIIATLPSPLTFLHQGSIRATMLAIANGTVAAAVMFLLLLLSDLVPLARHHPFARRFRRLADGTFAIYLMHYPLMILARSLNLLRPHFPLLDTVTMTVVVLSLIAIAAPLERLKSALRGTLHKVRFRQRTPAPQPVHTLP